jgi:photosystem II stability/assembly factor-like uncharacterized protein
VLVIVGRRVLLAGISAMAMACVGAAPAVAQVSVGHSGWFWGSPTPQGDALSAVTFDGAVGYAVGSFGTAVKSSDSGATWSGLATGTVNDLSVVQEVNPTTVVVGGGCSVRESVNGGASFVSLPINSSENDCPTDVASVSFLTPSSGYVELTDGTIFFTADTGQTLASKTSAPVNNGAAAEIDFISPTTGFAVAKAGDNGGGGVIERTTDSANSWTEVGSAPHGLNAITFVGATTAFAVGDHATLLESTDAGATWTAKPLALPAGAQPFNLEHISCADTMNCLISTADGKELIRTSDGGMTGSIVTPSSRTLSDVAFSTGTNVVGVGTLGTTVLSADGGQTFPTTISSRLQFAFDSSNPAVIRAGGVAGDAYLPGNNGRIAATTNGGASWSVLRAPTTSSIDDVAFPSTALGYEIESDGELRKTTTGGISWQTLEATVSDQAALAVTNARTVLVIGPHGVRRSTDGGQSFTPVAGSVVLPGKKSKHKKAGPKVSKLALGRALTVGRTVVAWGDHGIYESTTSGATWRSIPLPAKASVTSVSFVSATTGYVLTSSGRVYVTRNSGGEWTEIDSIGSNQLANISFSSLNKGLIALDGAAFSDDVAPFNDADVLATSNGGKTWVPEIVDGQQSSAILATPAHDYYADLLDQDAGISDFFSTADGGASPEHSTLSISIGAKKLTAKALKKKHNQVTITGKLSPLTSAGEQVVLSYRVIGKSWNQRLLNVASNGKFTTTVKNVKTTTDFVAYALGDGVHDGIETPTTQLTVKH